jgi:hypothetical protein
MSSEKEGLSSCEKEGRGEVLEAQRLFNALTQDVCLISIHR